MRAINNSLVNALTLTIDYNYSREPAYFVTIPLNLQSIHIDKKMLDLYVTFYIHKKYNFLL